MASIGWEGKRARIVFRDEDGKQQSIRLGECPKSDANTARMAIGHLVIAKRHASVPHPDAVRWLSGIDGSLYDRVTARGLCQPREGAAVVTLDAMLKAFFESVVVKPASRVRMLQAKAALLGHFKDGRDVATITEADADLWRAGLKTDGYASATISRTVLYARQMFRWGIRRGMVASNPFGELKAGSQTNTARQVFIDRATIAKVIDAAPDAEWRLLIALSRFGGLRVPSEALALTWGDVDWEHNRMTVRSAKTEHHEGKGERIIPIFPEVREHLQAVYDAAPVGAVNVIGQYREGQNLNPHFRRIIRRAGVTPWVKTWHNLRASRQTELASGFPLHTVCAWIGNSKAIAAGHYLQVTDADWTRAVGGPVEAAANPATHTRITDPKGEDAKTTNPQNHGDLVGVGAGCDPVETGLVGRAGLEHPRKPAGNPGCSETSGSKSGNIGGGSGTPTPPVTPTIADLVAMTMACPDLSEPIRAAMLALLGTTTPPEARSARQTDSCG